MKRYIILILIFFWVLPGCDDFLEEDSKENQYARTCSDLNELLVGNGYMQHKVVETMGRFDVTAKDNVYFPFLNIMDDDAETYVRGTFSKSYALTKLESFYIWEKDPCQVDGVLYTDKTWGRLYEHIAVLNVILDKVEEFTNDTEADRNAVKGQCYFLRASYYFLLVNLYAKPYDPITASRDLGVPIKLTPYVEDINYTRAPVDSVYHQIVRDLKQAVHYLDGYQPTTVRRATQNAARLLLSRVYCYMGEWELVPDLCNAILTENRYSFKDLRTSKDTSWIDVNSPEIIFTQGSNCANAVFSLIGNNSTGMSAFRISDELVSLFRENDDCREKFFFVQEAKEHVNFYIPRKSKALAEKEEYSFVSDNFSFRLSEVYLNLAEALAMTDQEGLAREALKTLMNNRINNLRSITETGKDLIDLIRKERRRELCFEGHRWFDLRRYSVCPKYPELKSIKHKVYDYAYGDLNTLGMYRGYYLLPEYPDGGWVLPIPSAEIEQTEGAIVNNNRENCILYEN